MSTPECDIWQFIANKRAGSKRLEQSWQQVLECLKKHNIAVDIHLTSQEGDARRLAGELVQKGKKKFIISGGDGTLSEAVDGICANQTDCSDITLALLPLGTGNDFARFWQISKSVDSMIEMIAKGKTALVDIGKVEIVSEDKKENKIRYFINAMGLGFDSFVVTETEKLQKVFKGSSWTYSVAVFMAIFKHRSQPMRWQFESTTLVDNVYTASVGNGCYTGGGIKQTPHAKPFDGLFDVMICTQLSFSTIVKAAFLLFRGKLLEHPCVRLVQTKSFSLTAEKPVAIEFDGIIEPMVKQLQVDILPQHIHFIVP